MDLFRRRRSLVEDIQQKASAFVSRRLGDELSVGRPVPDPQHGGWDVAIYSSSHPTVEIGRLSLDASGEVKEQTSRDHLAAALHDVDRRWTVGGKMTEDELRRCVLKVVSPYEGSAVLAGDGLAVTCDHVGVKGRRDQSHEVDFEYVDQHGGVTRLRGHSLPRESAHQHDIAVIQLDDPPATLPAAVLGTDYRQGDPVVALGFSAGQNRLEAAEANVFSGHDAVREIAFADKTKYEVLRFRIQTEMQSGYYAGMSGGPVLNLRTGQVIAIVEGKSLKVSPHDPLDGYGIELRHLVRCSPRLRPLIVVGQPGPQEVVASQRDVSPPVSGPTLTPSAAAKAAPVLESEPKPDSRKWLKFVVAAAILVVALMGYYSFLAREPDGIGAPPDQPRTQSSQPSVPAPEPTVSMGGVTGVTAPLVKSAVLGGVDLTTCTLGAPCVPRSMSETLVLEFTQRGFYQVFMLDPYGGRFLQGDGQGVSATVPVFFGGPGRFKLVVLTGTSPIPFSASADSPGEIQVEAHFNLP